MSRRTDRQEAGTWAWLLIGIPAVAGWIALGFTWLIEPRLAVELQPVAVGLWAISAYYVFLAVCWGGWITLFMLAP